MFAIMPCMSLVKVTLPMQLTKTYRCPTVLCCLLLKVLGLIAEYPNKFVCKRKIKTAVWCTHIYTRALGMQFAIHHTLFTAHYMQSTCASGGWLELARLRNCLARCPAQRAGAVATYHKPAQQCMHYAAIPQRSDYC